jgi:hypothetical protein
MMGLWCFQLGPGSFAYRRDSGWTDGRLRPDGGGRGEMVLVVVRWSRELGVVNFRVEIDVTKAA